MICFVHGSHLRSLLFFMNLSSSYIMMDLQPYNKDSLGV